jgi:hypothetical protein
MRRLNSTSRLIAAALLSIAMTPWAARACAVPVFRYALERWKPSPYQVTVFHRGALSDAQRLLLKELENASATANLKVEAVDLAGEPSAEARTLWGLQGGSAALPRVIVRYPENDAEATPVSSGPLDEPYLRSLLDSPARRRLVQHLGNGESAVWVVLESGDRAADEQAAKMLEAELERLRGDLKLTDPDARDLLSTKIPLKLSFVVLRVSRSDPDEARLVEMLLGDEEGLEKVRGPIAFPVFGRGRVRLALHGPRLRPTEVERWASSLCGPCSCVLKEQNPGFDLLLTAAWDELLELSPAVEDGQPIAAPPIPPGTSSPGPSEPTEGGGAWWLAGAAGLLVVLTAALALRDRRSAVP